ncbi:DMT family transporter [Paracoccus sulfuroxidans]|uniref:S-adenosylmethionine uptake transporter n=1 Tax=Paracoccus sulfuroxidans TaxID=384678 RepID=A0A562P153_9RHOB|nr:DMT family transporter [Paracoccus sulfuroxidans]TWI38164.1 S-adenosylmethionine uptake transporter [Paracoccus sulfuroxidans]
MTRSPRASVNGIIWMAGAIASFIGMTVASREMAQGMSIRQVLFFRALVGLAIVAVFAHRVWPEIRQMRQFRGHLLRNIVHFIAQYFWTIGVVMLPLASVFALEFTMPIWVAVFAWALLGENISTARLLATLGGFLGVVLIVRPGMGTVDPAAGLVLLAAVGYGLSIVLVKRLSRQSSAGAIVVWMMLIQTPLGLLSALTDWQPIDWSTWPWILLAGAGALSAHFCLAQALRRLDATIIMPVDFLRVPLIAAVGYLLYDEGIDLWVVIGAGVILLSNLYALRAETRASLA